MFLFHTLRDMSGFGVIEESPVSERLYFCQVFYRGYHSHPQVHEIHIIFTWNTEAHLNVSYSSDLLFLVY